jgi:hypothetical protein
MVVRCWASRREPSRAATVGASAVPYHVAYSVGSEEGFEPCWRRPELLASTCGALPNQPAQDILDSHAESEDGLHVSWRACAQRPSYFDGRASFTALGESDSKRTTLICERLPRGAFRAVERTTGGTLSCLLPQLRICDPHLANQLHQLESQRICDEPMVRETSVGRFGVGHALPPSRRPHASAPPPKASLAGAGGRRARPGQDPPQIARRGRPPPQAEPANRTRNRKPNPNPEPANRTRTRTRNPNPT